jgi:hypothetical protein
MTHSELVAKVVADRAEVEGLVVQVKALAMGRKADPHWVELAQRADEYSRWLDRALLDVMIAATRKSRDAAMASVDWFKSDLTEMAVHAAIDAA